ncbi:MAG: aldose 1-epimerase family protein [Acidimicrobiales bacterium]
MGSDSSARAPSGHQYVIGHGVARAVITEVGAAVREYSLGGVDIVDGFAVSDMCSAARGQVLAPWPNRLGDGRYEFSGRRARAALDEPERSNAIHGLVRFRPWTLLSQAQNVVVLGIELDPQPGYPWRIGIEIEYRLGRDGLSVRVAADNRDEVAAPFGIGFHPYLTVGTPTVDTARLRIGSRSVLRTDERGLPVGTGPASGSELDFNVARPIGPTQLDTCYFDLSRDAHGVTRAQLAHPDSDRRIELWMDRSFDYLMAYTADHVERDRCRRSVALEPMSCPPDALRSGTGLVRLDPGASWTGHWGITPTS